MTQGRRTEWLNLLDRSLFGALMAILIWHAWSVLDTNWDSFAYHLPFAARRIGLISAQQYEFTPWLEGYYAGFPSAIYYVYGALWRVTGSVNAPNIVSTLAFAGYCAYLRGAFRVPLIIGALAIAAIPVVQVGLGSVYTDLIANLAFAGALVNTTALFTRQTNVTNNVLMIAVFAAISANAKLPFVPLAAVLLATLALGLVYARAGNKRMLAVLADELRHRPVAAVCLGLVLCAAAAPALNNTFVHGNPLYPMGIVVRGHKLFPGLEATALYRDPAYLANAPQSYRWLLSVMEYLSLGERPLPYTMGQGDAAPDAPSLRMGGYLSLWVFYNIIVLILLARPRKPFVPLSFAGLSALVSTLPASHELRYYSFWMIYLVSINLIQLWSAVGEPVQRKHYAAVAFSAALFVSSVTGFRHLWEPPLHIQDLIASWALQQKYENRLQDDRRVCLIGWQPFALLGASYFYPGATFDVVERSASEDCPIDASPVPFARVRN